MTRTPIISLIATLLVAAVLAACSPKSADPGEFINIDPAGWAYGQVLKFTPGADSCYLRTETANDSLASGSRIALSLRHSDAYAYANLWLEISYPSADTTLSDTVNMVLADRYGKWHGTGIGPSYQYSDTITTRARINDNPSIGVRHIMRIDTLCEIEQVGLRIISR